MEKIKREGRTERGMQRGCWGKDVPDYPLRNLSRVDQLTEKRRPIGCRPVGLSSK